MLRKKNLRQTNYSSFFCKSAESGRFFIYLHDSNSIFWAQGIKSEGFLGRTVMRLISSVGTSWNSPRRDVGVTVCVHLGTLNNDTVDVVFITGVSGVRSLSSAIVSLSIVTSAVRFNVAPTLSTKRPLFASPNLKNPCCGSASSLVYVSFDLRVVCCACFAECLQFGIATLEYCVYDEVCGLSR